jgi:hypothetical protein
MCCYAEILTQFNIIVPSNFEESFPWLGLHLDSILITSRLQEGE